ncbi:MAG TPA: glucoamylase family protein [Petrotogaceae bacterium]|nr:glucoamylase family protein [Petrotogaceae bacterium]
MGRNDIVQTEAKLSFDFFWNEASLMENSYGLIKDNTVHDAASIASVGFGLSAIVVGVNRGWITREEGYKRVVGTLKTFYSKAEQKEGFFIHFLDMQTARRTWHSEVSVIDTAIFLMGALCAAEYFKGEAEEYFEKIYKRVNWQWYTNKKKNMFYMGYWYENGFHGAWDLYAEQLMMYILGAASPSFPIDPSMYYEFKRNTGCYRDYQLIYTWTGSIFTYQFTHAWIDFRKLYDKNGVNWYENSVNATKAARQYCIDLKGKYKTFGECSWGLTACDSPDGYRGDFGAAPNGENSTVGKTDGTIPPAGAIGSIVFVPDEVIDAMNHYRTFDNLWGRYGFKDAYNLDKNWFSKTHIGIDKGISLLMIENYLSGLIWEVTMRNKYIKKGLEKLLIVPG